MKYLKGKKISQQLKKINQILKKKTSKKYKQEKNVGKNSK